jgi:hypothetical protein
MMLKSFGCSFIFGSDLADDGRFGGHATYSLYTWPAVLSRRLSLQYSCYAKPGSGNLRILERVLTQAACNEKDLFVIGWSYIDRFDHADADDKWKTVLPGENSDLADFYYRNFHSQFKDKLTSLVCIKTAIDVLTSKQIPFVMTYMDSLLFEKEWHTTPAITDLQDQIFPYMKTFDGQSFLNWSRINGFEISEKQHPLEQAHKSAAELMLPVAQEILQN